MRFKESDFFRGRWSQQLAIILAEKKKPLTKAQFKQLQKYFEENPWIGPPELLYNEDGSERLEKPSQKFIEYLCWGGFGAESWVQSIADVD
jgi:hypothetical protein